MIRGIVEHGGTSDNAVPLHGTQPIDSRNDRLAGVPMVTPSIDPASLGALYRDPKILVSVA
jgi:hypothetical protein